MKILIVSTYDSHGGAPRAARRLHSALLEIGHESKMLVFQKLSDDYTIIGPTSRLERVTNFFRIYIDAIPIKLRRKKPESLFSVGLLPNATLIQKINRLKPDLVHLHWIGGGMLRFEDIENIKAPIVWTLHDNSPFTGGCHIMWDCEKYKDSCGACPRLFSVKENDLSRWIIQRKLKHSQYLQKAIIVGVSQWISRCAKESKVFSRNRVNTIPNPLNTNIYYPIPKQMARNLFQLPQERRLVLFGAISSTSDINKGFRELCVALDLIKTDVDIVIFGASAPEALPSLPHKIHYAGILYDDQSLAILYSACDVVVVPSRQESFGQTASEAMSCGTPVVAFATTGLLDIVDHKINGYLAEPFNSLDLATGIDWILNNEQYPDISRLARDKCLRVFNDHIVAKKYVAIYQEAVLQ